ncbi:hypothetical protein P879_01131 [Paragonimus westermani]|uniref:Uncharacterized protein n=1 Tax=Paragonimus westermani TaxID=34504 RepID=A0A8T0DHH9_9TREM|nr:hypothetical protein P879_01131 [Paragonimus westermani]
MEALINKFISPSYKRFVQIYRLAVVKPAHYGTNQLQQHSSSVSRPIPQFGRDYRQNTQVRRNSDHSVPPEFHTGQMVKPNLPSSPAKLVGVTTGTTSSRDPTETQKTSWSGPGSNFNLPHTQISMANQPVTQPSFDSLYSRAGDGEIRYDRQTDCSESMGVVYARPEQAFGRGGRGQLRPDSMYLPSTSEPQSQVRSMEKSFLNLNLHPEPVYKDSPNQVQQPTSVNQQPVPFITEVPPQIIFQPIQQPPGYVCATLNSAVQQSTPSSHVSASDLTQLATGFSQGNFRQIPNNMNVAVTAPSSLVGLFGNQPAYFCTPYVQQQQQQHLPQSDATGNFQRSAMPGRPIPLVPGPTLIQPQVAIVAADPATLRALLTGGLNAQAFLQPMILTQPPIQAITTEQQFDQSQITSTQFYEPWSVPLNAAPIQPPLAQTDDTKFTPFTMANQPLSNMEPEHYQPEELRSRTVATGKTRTEHVVPRRLPQPQQTNDDLHVSFKAESVRPDVVVQTRHSTTEPHRTQPQTQFPLDESSCQSVSKIGHPPRTLRQLAKPDILEGSQLADETRHTTSIPHSYREPRKLDPNAFLDKSMKINSVERRRQKSLDKDVWGTGDADSFGRRRDPNSISAYYEKIKQRGNRPLSAYRPTTYSETTVKAPDLRRAPANPQVRSTSSAPRQIQPVIPRQEMRSSDSRQAGPMLKRAVTFSNEQRSFNPITTESGSLTKPGIKDPTLMSVAERARQWLEGRERELTDRYRYSTCGFIDQDLIDCQELVPVEDRVKMFDTGVSGIRDSEGRLTKKPLIDQSHQVTSIQTEIDDRSTREKPETVAYAPNKAVASVKLESTRSTLGSSLLPRSSVGLQQLRMSVPSGPSRPTQIIPLSAVSASSIKPDTSISTQGDELSGMSVREKRRLFSHENWSLRPATGRSAIRRKTQPVTLDDLARANQLILARMDGRSLESPPSTYRGEDNDSIGFQERMSEISTPEASLLSF